MGKGTKVSVKVKGKNPRQVKKALAEIVGMPEVSPFQLREADFRQQAKKQSSGN